jgi:hypothetical protein
MYDLYNDVEVNEPILEDTKFADEFDPATTSRSDKMEDGAQ